MYGVRTLDWVRDTISQTESIFHVDRGSRNIKTASGQSLQEEFMVTEKRLLIYNIIALLCAIWFVLTGWMWFYYMNIILSFPFAILGFFLWKKGREAEKKTLNKITGWLLMAGVIISFGYLIGATLSNS